MATKLKIGLVGFGCVGKGLVSVLAREKDPEVEVLGICVRDLGKPRETFGIPIVADFRTLLGIEGLDAIVEVTNDPAFAWKVAEETLRVGKDLITANKAMVSGHLNEIIALQQETGARVLFDSAVAANIPILQNLETWFDHDWIVGLRGVLNGTSNYILEKIRKEGLTYSHALEKAIQEGYAETDPSADVLGWDARHKLNILNAHTFGVWTDPSQILALGIDQISPLEVQFAAHRGWRIRQVGFAQKWGDSLFSAVLPCFVTPEDPLFQLEGAFNGIVLEDGFGETHFFKGKGAGGETTGAAIFADLRALSRGFRYQWGKYRRNVFLKHRDTEKVDIYFRYARPSGQEEIEFLKVYERHLEGDGGWILGQTTLEAIRRFAKREKLSEHFIALLPNSISHENPVLSGSKNLERKAGDR